MSTRTLTLSQIVRDPATLLGLVGEPVAPSAADLATAWSDRMAAFDMALNAAHLCSQKQISWNTYRTAEAEAISADLAFTTFAVPAN